MRRPKLLIVDDDELVLSSLQLEASENGYWTVTAQSGEEAIARAQSQSFDLVVCDVRMPGIDGIQAISELKKLQPAARYIVITGYASPDAPIRALKLRVDDYLLKPFDGPTFLASLQRALRLRQLERPGDASLFSTQDNLLSILSTVLKCPSLVKDRAASAAAQASSVGFSPPRVTQVYLASLVYDVEPTVLADTAGLSRLALLVNQAQRAEEIGDDKISPEARLVWRACRDSSHSNDGHSNPPFWINSWVGVENLFRLAQKHRLVGRFDSAQTLYREVLNQPDCYPELEAEVRLEELQLLLELGREAEVVSRGEKLRSLIVEHELGLLGARLSLLLARVSRRPEEELKEARRVFAQWEEHEKIACCDLLLAAAGVDEALSAWKDSPYFWESQGRYPQESSRLLGERPGAVTVVLEKPYRIALLGPLQVSFQGELLKDAVWKSKKDRLLFSFLSANFPRVVTEEELLDQFWPQGGERARHSLHNSISQIRRCLRREPVEGGDIVRRVKDGYTLGSLVETDLCLVTRKIKEGRAALADQTPRQALQLLQDARRLFRGDFLEGDYQEWTFHFREKAVSLQLDCLSQLGHYFQSRKKWRQALSCWQEILRLDPLNDDAYRSCFEAHGALGERAAGVKLFQSAREAYEEELGVPVPPDFEDFLSQI